MTFPGVAAGEGSAIVQSDWELTAEARSSGRIAAHSFIVGVVERANGVDRTKVRLQWRMHVIGFRARPRLCTIRSRHT